MRPFVRAIIILAVGAALVAAGGRLAFAQNLLPSAGQPASATAPGEAADTLGRQTPAGTVMGFLAAGARGDWARASRYLDSRAPAPQAEELAQQLKVLLDRGLGVDLDRLSRKPEGEQDERAGKDHESIGTIESPATRLDIVLVRVHLAGQPPIWLFSRETLLGVPALHSEFEPSFVEQYLPRSLTQGYGLNYMWWSWSLMLLAVIVSWVAAIALSRLLQGIARLVFNVLPRRQVSGRWLGVVRPMRWLLFGIVMRLLTASFLTLRQRFLGGRMATLFILGALTWLAVKILAASVLRWTGKLERRGNTERIALVRLAGRLLQTAAVVVGVLGLLQAIGINMTPVLAGLGVGGIAVALASQKTLENLFGGMMVIGDSPVRIGQFCRIGTMTGTIEDIGLRSTRLRTLARTTISIPNADLASQSIENFATRDKLLFNHTFALRYETTSDQLRVVLAETRSLLQRHEKIETDSARIRLLRLAASGLDVEVFAYVQTTDFAVFLGIQEDLLLRLMHIVESSGTALAFPSQTMYFTRDQGIDPRRAEEAEAAIRTWRERGELPFAVLPTDDTPRLRGEPEFPSEGSALRGDVNRT